MSFVHLLYALIAGILPSVIWFVFWNREDADQPEPRGLLTMCFFGGVVAVIGAIFGEQYAASHTNTEFAKYVSWASIEEVLKFLAVGIVALRSRFYDEPIDAMIYCIAVALGFAALENTLFIMGPFSHGDVGAGLATGSMRFIGATLVHVVSAALVGFSLAVSFYKPMYVKILSAIVGLGAAITLHASFNLSIITADAGDTLKTFGWVWLAVVIMIVLFEEIKNVRPHFA